MKVYFRKPGEGKEIQFSYQSEDYEVFGTESWKIIIYLIIAFVYLAIGFLLYKKCTSNSQTLQGDNDYISVN
jgi:hypothetical protein